MPVQFGSLDPPVEGGRERERARRGSWVGAHRHFYFSTLSSGTDPSMNMSTNSTLLLTTVHFQCAKYLEAASPCVESSYRRR